MHTPFVLSNTYLYDRLLRHDNPHGHRHIHCYSLNFFGFFCQELLCSIFLDIPKFHHVRNRINRSSIT